MGKYNDLQTRLAAERSSQQQERDYQKIAAAEARQQAAIRAAELDQKFNEARRIGAHIASTLVARGERGDFRIVGEREGMFGFNKVWTIASGWVLSSWQVGSSFESMQTVAGTCEIARYAGTVLTEDGAYLAVNQTHAADDPQLNSMRMLYARDGRTLSSSAQRIEDITSYHQLKAVPDIDHALATFALDHSVSLAGF